MLVACSVSLALFAMVDTGVYLYAAYCGYLILLLLIPDLRCIFFSSSHNRFRAWLQGLKYIVYFILPLSVTSLIFIYFSNNQLGLFLANTFEFSASFRVGFSSILFWQNINHVIPFLIGILVPVVFLLTICIGFSFGYFGERNPKHLLAAILSIYGLGCWNYYMCRPYPGSMNYFSIPVILVLCCWIETALNSKKEKTRKIITFSLMVIAFYCLGTTHRFIKSANVLNLSRDYFVKERKIMQNGFITPQDVGLVRKYTLPNEKVCVFSSFEIGLLMATDRLPFFYYSPLFQNAAMNTLDFYAMNLTTYSRLDKTLQELQRGNPRYIFVERKVQELGVHEHLAYMFEPMFLLQKIYIKKHYQAVDSSKNLVVLERKYAAEK